MVAWLYEFYFLVVKDNILALENKIPIFAPPCNILYMFWVNANVPREARTFFSHLLDETCSPLSINYHKVHRA